MADRTEPPKHLKTPEELRNEAFALFKPPFRYDKGYIWDDANQMVADTHIEDANPDPIGRVRGWGRIQKVGPHAGALQDMVGQMMAEALTRLWGREDWK